jgi:hypothetical protein
MINDAHQCKQAILYYKYLGPFLIVVVNYFNALLLKLITN